MQEINPESAVAHPPAAVPHTTPDHSALSREVAEMRALLDSQGKMLRSIRRSLRLSTILSYVRFFLFLIPFILAIIFLPPVIEQFMQTLDAFRGEGDSQYGLTLPKGLDIKQLDELCRQSGSTER